LRPNLQYLSTAISGILAVTSSNDSAIRYVLPVVWMTSSHKGPNAGTRQVAPPNCAPGAKSVIADCLVKWYSYQSSFVALIDKSAYGCIPFERLRDKNAGYDLTR